MSPAIPRSLPFAPANGAGLPIPAAPASAPILLDSTHTAGSRSIPVAGAGGTHALIRKFMADHGSDAGPAAKKRKLTDIRTPSAVQRASLWTVSSSRQFEAGLALVCQLPDDDQAMLPPGLQLSAHWHAPQVQVSSRSLALGTLLHALPQFDLLSEGRAVLNDLFEQIVALPRNQRQPLAFGVLHASDKLPADMDGLENCARLLDPVYLPEHKLSQLRSMLRQTVLQAPSSARRTALLAALDDQAGTHLDQLILSMSTLGTRALARQLEPAIDSIELLQSDAEKIRYQRLLEPHISRLAIDQQPALAWKLALQTSRIAPDSIALA